MPAGLARWFDIGGGVVVLAHHPTTDAQLVPLAHEPMELVAIDIPSARILWRREFPRITQDFVAAAPDRLYAVREGEEPWNHELVLIDVRTGSEVAARRLVLAPRLCAPVDRTGSEDRHWSSRRDRLDACFGLSTGSGRVLARVAGDKIPDALSAAPFDLPCIVVPQVLESPLPVPRLRASWDVKGHSLVLFDNGGSYCHEIGQVGPKWHYDFDSIPLAALDSGFFYWKQHAERGELMVVDAESGEIRGRGRISPELMPHFNTTCVVGDVLLFVASKSTGQGLSRSWAESSIVAISTRTLDLLWSVTDAIPFGTVYATATEVFRFTEKGEPGTLAIRVIDLATGAERGTVTIPFERGRRPPRYDMFGNPERATLGGPPDRSYSMLIAGRFVVASDAGIYGVGP